MNFFQDYRLSPTAGFVPCAAWLGLLSDNKNGLESLKWLPHFLILFQDITEADLFYFGLKTLYDCIKANAVDDQIITALNVSHDAVIAYQRFIQGRDQSIWLPVLYQEETQWSAAYFEILHYDQYREAPECIVKSTLYAADLPEVKWMLSLGIIIARSDKSQDSQFLSWATSVIQTENYDKKKLHTSIISESNWARFLSRPLFLTTFMAALVQKPTLSDRSAALFGTNNSRYPRT